MEVTTKHIWNPEKGIADFEDDPQQFKASEIPGIKAVWKDRQELLSRTNQLTPFTEKLSREWAIETGIIENLYDIDRGVTQTLIEHGFQAELLGHGSTNKPKEYVLNLLRDQKDALDGVFDFVRSERNLTVSYIKDLHSALLRSQTTTEAIDRSGNVVKVELIRGDWKSLPNSPERNGVTYSYCPPEHVASEMDRMVAIHREHIDKKVWPEVQAAWLHHRFTQIHPFQDGNGRVARAIASLVLIKGGLFPLVVTRDDRLTYINALEAADDGNLGTLVELIARLQRVQFTKAFAVSESVLAEDADVEAMLGDLQRAADKVAAEKLKAQRKVFEWAQALEVDLFQRLESIAPAISSALTKVNRAASAFVTRSDENTDHYFRAQIIQNAKRNLNYYADPSDYRSWVALNFVWQRRARLVFALHGIGRPFSGSLICAPFLEFRDTDDDGQTSATLVPVSEEGFVFFYSDTKDQLLSRFKPWREKAIKIAIREMSQSL